MAELYLLSGAGNDFLAQVDPATTPEAATVRAWCRRGTSLGADGFLTLERFEDGVRLGHWNPDGQRSALCLNGSRCAVQLACHLGWHVGGRLVLYTDSGPLVGRRIDARRTSVDLPPVLGEPTPCSLRLDGETFETWRLRVGVPHLVVPWEGGLADLPMGRLGPALRAHPDLGPEGANVDFVHFLDTDRFEVRCYERGVEGETLACGTGVVAASAVGVATGWLTPPVVAVTAGGFDLGVSGSVADNRLSHVSLSGDARLLARLDVTAAAAITCQPPVWSP